jgi:muramidase (phage lysozyme)
MTSIQTEDVRELLDLIGKAESGNNYNIIFGGKKVPLTTLTLKQVLDFQQNLRVNKTKSTAVGCYQFILITLTDLQSSLKIPLESLFDKQFQDTMAVKLLQRRGLTKFLEGTIPLDEFMVNLSKEWASLPKDVTGVSYYHGDGLNKALVRPSDLIEVLKKLKEKFDGKS